MEVSIKRRIVDAIKHRYVTDLYVGEKRNLDFTICDVVAPTYLADINVLDNQRAFTISPLLGKMIETSSIPFNKLISISGINMRRLKRNMNKVKKKKIVFASIGYGGLSMNVLHFISLLSYRTGVIEPFSQLHIFEEDNISYSNLPRFYKDLFGFPVAHGETQNKINFFDEENIAEKIVLHNYRVEKDEIEAMKDYGSTVYFGAPDYKTRKLLENENFMFAGHKGDSVIIVKSPIVDTDLTRESYGTVNLTSFFMNMIVLADGIFDVLAKDFVSEDHDAVLFEHNAKENIKNSLEFERFIDEEKDIGIYKYSNTLKIAI